jgi:hypothetical protein
MLKALRIASIVTIVAAAAVVVFVALFGLRGNAEIETFLQREGIVDQFRKKIQNIPQKSDAVSPLEVASKAFAVRIDPPPPPKPIEPVKPPQEVVKPPVAIQPPRPPVENKPVLSAKFTLEATARYPDQPQKSMALLKSVQNEFKWYKQGEQVGHLEIQEIKDGSVVLYQGGKFNSEVFMPAPPKVRSLLKGEDTGEEVQPQGPVAVTLPEESPEIVEEQPADVTAEPLPTGPAARRTIPSRLETYRQGRTSAPSTTLRTTPPQPSTPVPVQTPEEQKQSINESISSIEQIMTRPPVEGQSEEERKQEQEAWRQLINALKEDQQNIDQPAPETPAEPAPSEPAQSSEQPKADQPAPEQPAQESDSEGSGKIE